MVLSPKAHAFLDHGLRALWLGTVASLVAGYVLTDWDAIADQRA